VGRSADEWDAIADELEGQAVELADGPEWDAGEVQGIELVLAAAAFASAADGVRRGAENVRRAGIIAAG